MRGHRAAAETTARTASSHRAEPTDRSEFEAFVEGDGARLRRVLVARFGVETGSDVHAQVLGELWRDWERIAPMDNRIGYAFRMAQSASRWYHRWTRRAVFPTEMPEPGTAPESGDIFLSLGGLSADQRTCVVLVHAYGWAYREVADVLGISITAVTNHVHRGMKQLRIDLGGET